MNISIALVSFFRVISVSYASISHQLLEEYVIDSIRWWTGFAKMGNFDTASVIYI